MAFNYFDDYRKVAKWTDDIKRDIRFFGVGTVGKQIQYPNGSKVDYANEDRSFSYELKENEIFAYGIIDGFNGTWTVDFVEQCLMSNICFDYLPHLQEMSDEQIYAVLDDEFSKTEKVLQDNLEELLNKRSSKALLNGELKKGTMEYLENKREINEIDKKIDSGAFATISLLINDRLYVANVGNVHCFVCTYNKRTFEKRVTTLETVHTLANIAEMLRLADLKADVQEALLKGGSSFTGGYITYTRCLGDFKHKLYYHEQPQFKDCTKPPISCNSDHPKTSVKIDDTYLFMAMYSDGLVKAIEKTDMASENVNAIIARMLLRKIVSEQTLNSAAQSVLDEIKRAYDDKLMSTYSERDDFTLIVRVFDFDIKNKLVAIENHMKPSQSTNTLTSTVNDGRRATFIEEDEGNFSDEDRTRRGSTSCESTLESSYSSLISTSINNHHRQNSSEEMETRGSADKSKREDLPLESLVDESGRVVPYLELDKFDEMLNSASGEHRDLFDRYCDELAALKIERI